MELRTIDYSQLVINPYDLISRQSLVLTSGSFAEHAFNAMTISWGFLGVLWDKPCMLVAVRPTRFTYTFLERSSDFTVCAFPPAFKRDVAYLGSHSGRDEDKIAKTHLTPIASTQVQTPCYAEAELILECHKIYWSDLDPAHFLDSSIFNNYPRKDYHRLYIGEIIAIRAAERFIQDKSSCK